MTLLYTDPLFLRHETGRHPERPDRLRAVTALLAKSGVAGLCDPGDYQPMSEEEVKELHDPQQVLFAKRVCEQGGGRLDGDTAVSPESFTVALAAAGACVAAVDAVLDGKDRNALCLVRPPGHHATPTTQHGLLPVQQHRPGRPARPQGSRPDAHPDRRLGRASRQRHAGHFLRRPRGACSSASIAMARLLSRHRRRRRDRHRPRPRPHPQRADPLRHVAARITAPRFATPWRRRPTRSSRNWCCSAPASTPTPPIRSARSAWRSRTSPS